MKAPYIKTLGFIVVAIAIALVFTSYKTSSKYRFDKTAEELHKELLTNSHNINPNDALKLIEGGSDDYVFIDIRNPREYDNFHIKGSVNVPQQRVLDENYVPYLQNNKKKILYSDHSIKADQIRVLLTQYGYKNLYVLQGGATYWKENMLNRDVFKGTAVYDDEQLKFDFKKLTSSK